MRKIILIQELDRESFQPIVTLKEKLEDGTINTIFSQTLERFYSKYTKEQLEKIDQCNQILTSKELPVLTDKEIDYMLDPEGFNKRLNELEQEMKDLSNLQRLAGFRVEKKIIQLG